MIFVIAVVLCVAMIMSPAYLSNPKPAPISFIFLRFLVRRRCRCVVAVAIISSRQTHIKLHNIRKVFKRQKKKLWLYTQWARAENIGSADCVARMHIYEAKYITRALTYIIFIFLLRCRIPSTPHPLSCPAYMVFLSNTATYTAYLSNIQYKGVVYIILYRCAVQKVTFDVGSDAYAMSAVWSLQTSSGFPTKLIVDFQ